MVEVDRYTACIGAAAEAVDHTAAADVEAGQVERYTVADRKPVLVAMNTSRGIAVEVGRYS